MKNYRPTTHLEKLINALLADKIDISFDRLITREEFDKRKEHLTKKMEISMSIIRYSYADLLSKIAIGKKTSTGILFAVLNLDCDEYEKNTVYKHLLNIYTIDSMIWKLSTMIIRDIIYETVDYGDPDPQL